MNRKKLGILCRVTIFLVLICIILYRINYVFRDKNECESITGFLDEKVDSIDVVFLGSSQVLNGINPVLLWKDYGISSYNCATSNTNIPMMYYTAEYIFERQHPKVVVADLSFVYDDEKIVNTEGMHAIWDNIPVCRTKVQAISDLVPEESRMELLMPLYIFHSRWSSLMESDFKKISLDRNFKGATTIDEYVQPQKVNHIEAPKESKELNATVYAYLIKLIELCDKNNAELVLVALPCPYLSDNENYMMTLNTVDKISNDNNVDFVNVWKERFLWGLDYYTDYSDYAHVNFRGQEKMTKQIGEYLINKIDLPDRRGDDDYISFDEEYAKYQNYLASECSYAHYTDGSVSDFVSEFQNDFFCNGTWPSNGISSWSGGEQNDAFFYLDDLDGVSSVTMSFDFEDVNDTYRDEQHIEVYFNDVPVCQWSIGKTNINDSYECVIPVDRINKGSENHLTVKYKDVDGVVVSKYRDMLEADDPLNAVAYKSIEFRYDR